MTANQSRVMELEEKIRKFGYVNDDLRSQLFTVSQRPNHLAESMGFSTAEELQAAIARRPHAFNKKSIEEAGRIIDELEARVVDHIRIEKAAQEGLADAAQEIDRMTGENSRLLRHLEEVIQEKDELAKHVEELERESGRRHPQGVYNTGLPTPATTTKKRTLPSADATPHNAASSTPHRPEAAPGMLTVTPATPSLPPLTLSADTQTDTTILRAELRALHAQYEALRLVKDRAENKYREDYLKWRGFKRWMFDESKATLSDVMVDGRTPNLKHVVKVRKRYMKTGPQTDSPGLGTEDARAEEVREAVKNNAEVREMVAALPDEFEQGMSTAPQSSLTARLLEARRPHPPDTPPVQDLSVSPKRGGGESVASTSVSQGKKRAIEETTETIVSAAVSSPLTPRRKRQRYDDSSETEEESQGEYHVHTIHLHPLTIINA
ncbi:uncharacterized protein C8Q71DRAFT_402322 [Rhodofomes roseus]|uniref:Uncharacterized protein n=1 Tax=Rhodofomes roseus TaxID=34475 RepID=A0ABQ8K0H3_9APHY|nr:uncharacterized protein C8Q71DRAFT_402322 [Rhodofomes roseus]KAH9829576.1 hypothetical protein C8Q71DRAFT_402322 [Rhodofomes roseus]